MAVNIPQSAGRGRKSWANSSFDDGKFLIYHNEMQNRALANAGLVIALGGLGVLAVRWAQPAPRPPSRAAQLALKSTMLPNDETRCQAALEQRATELYAVGELSSTPAPAIRVDRLTVRPVKVAEMDMPNAMHRIQEPTSAPEMAEMDMPNAFYRVRGPTDPTDPVYVAEMDTGCFRVHEPTSPPEVAEMVATLDADRLQ
jgi:hypothetical protein